MNKAVPGDAVLVVPGFHGSGPGHWQTWFEGELPGARRIGRIDWEQPVLATWAARIRDELSAAPAPLWLVAHSFGCLATVVAVADRPEKVAGLLLVAPASPDRFDCLGLLGAEGRVRDSLRQVLPARPLEVDGMLVASRNDPWLDYAGACALAQTWGLRLVDAGEAGHLNEHSGHGEWPPALDLLQQLQATAAPPRTPLPVPPLRRGRGGALALVRQATRAQMENR